jgi:histidyl-tRNA synthetase
MLTSAPRGTFDVLPDQTPRWQRLESILRGVAERFGCREIRVPAFEHTELFNRAVGDTTDVMQKEMYTFEDRGGRSISLRPEGTASVARSFVEHGLYGQALPFKVYYILPNFRYDKPQAGRYRQHHQFGVEYFGAPGPECDAEVISVASALLEQIGIKGATPHINSLGCKDCRDKYNEVLKTFLGDNIASLCPLCQTRFNKNPLRVLDCSGAYVKRAALA